MPVIGESINGVCGRCRQGFEYEFVGPRRKKLCPDCAMPPAHPKIGDSMTGVCKCGEPFKYVFEGRRKKLCPGCVGANYRAAHLRSQRRLKTVAGERVNEANCSALEHLAKMDRDEIGRRLRLTPAAVRMLERNALFKIRRNPELRRLFAFYLSEGGGSAECGVRSAELGNPEFGNREGEELILDWQLGVGEMFEAYDRLLAGGFLKEAGECLLEIALFQREMCKVLETEREPAEVLSPGSKVQSPEDRAKAERTVSGKVGGSVSGIGH